MRTIGRVEDERIKTTKTATTIEGKTLGWPAAAKVGSWDWSTPSPEQYRFEIRFKPGSRVFIDLEVQTCNRDWHSLGVDQRTDLKKAILDHYKDHLVGCIKPAGCNHPGEPCYVPNYPAMRRLKEPK